jgi:hypothetical protein
MATKIVDNQLKNYVENNGLNSYVDWESHKLCNIPFNELNMLDFRKKRGRDVKQKCNIDTKKLKTVTKKLYNYSLQIKDKISYNYDDCMVSHIQCIKAYVLRWWTLYQIRQKGSLFYARHRLANEQDPITLEECNNISSIYIFVFYQNNKHYGIDIRNLEKMIQSDMKNPFTKEPFDDTIQKAMNIRLQKIISLGISTQLIKDPKPTNVLDKIKARVVTLFQTIDALDNYTDIYWFLRLNIVQLKLWYIRAEDIWNYRTQLTVEQQKEIVPDSDVHILFPAKNSINSINNLSQLRMMVLDVMERLVTSAPQRSERILGAMYVLTALTECSPEVAIALPWLFQPPS